MNLQEWREAEKLGTGLTLPSGLQVRVKHVGLLDLLKAKKVPKPLLPLVKKVFKDGQLTITPRDMPRYFALVNLNLKAMLVEPPMAEKPDRDHLGADELPVRDRKVLFDWANRPIPIE